jgi:hypothetical protein
VVDCNFASGRGQNHLFMSILSPARGCRTRVATASSSPGTRASGVAGHGGARLSPSRERGVGAAGSPFLTFLFFSSSLLQCRSRISSSNPSRRTWSFSSSSKSWRLATEERPGSRRRPRWPSSSIWSPIRRTAAAVSSRLLYPDHERGMVLLSDLEAAAAAIAPTMTATPCSSSTTTTSCCFPDHDHTFCSG